MENNPNFLPFYYLPLLDRNIAMDGGKRFNDEDESSRQQTS